MYPPVFAAPFWLGMIASTIFPASVTPATIPLAPAISQNAPAPIRAELIPYYVLPKTEAGVDKIREVLRAIVKHAPESIQEIPRPSREIGSKFQGVLLWKFRGTNGEFEQLRNVLGNDAGVNDDRSKLRFDHSFDARKFSRSIIAPSKMGSEPPLLESYAAYPSVPSQIVRTGQSIQSIIRTDADSIFQHTCGDRPQLQKVVCWSFRATVDEYEQLKRDLSGHADIIPGETSAERQDLHPDAMIKRTEPSAVDGRVVNDMRQKNAPPDLKVVSWPPGASFADLKYYQFDDRVGVTSDIYIIDEGIDAQSTDFGGRKIRRWFYSPRLISVGRAKPTDDDALSHGTCVASKATGIFNGVSKLSGIIVIKTTLFSSDLLWAFDQILADIRLNKSQKHAVIIFPAMSNERYPDETTLPWVALKPMIQALFNEDAVVVINSGNEAGEPRAERKDVDTLPALWESPQFPLIVAGSVDNHGALTQFSQGPSHVTVWAPGSEVVCAKNRGYGTASGTSFSAGMVAGLVAYALALKNVPFQVGNRQTAANAKNYLAERASWQRQRGGPPVIWNGENGVDVSLSLSDLPLANFSTSQ